MGSLANGNHRHFRNKIWLRFQAKTNALAMSTLLPCGVVTDPDYGAPYKIMLCEAVNFFSGSKPPFRSSALRNGVTAVEPGGVGECFVDLYRPSIVGQNIPTSGEGGYTLHVMCPHGCWDHGAGADDSGDSGILLGPITQFGDDPELTIDGNPPGQFNKNAQNLFSAYIGLTPVLTQVSLSSVRSSNVSDAGIHRGGDPESNNHNLGIVSADATIGPVSNGGGVFLELQDAASDDGWMSNDREYPKNAQAWLYTHGDYDVSGETAGPAKALYAGGECGDVS